MKRLLCFFVVIILLLSIGFNSYADDSYIVHSDHVYAKQGETVTVPLKLSENKGLMGFRITIKYPNNQLELKDVSSGSVTFDGLFNTTITDYYSVKGTFDVVWSDNAEVKDDGTLFIMTYKVKESADDGEYNISVTYSQDDTFNEKFEDVKLSCSPAKVYIGDVIIPDTVQEDITNPETTSKKDTGGKQDGVSVSDDYLIASVEQIMQSFGADNMDTLTEEQQEAVLDYVNNRIDSYSGGKKYESFDELRQDYLDATKNEAARKVVESTDPDAIMKAADEVLKEYGVNSFSEIPADKKQEAVDNMLQKLADEGSDEKGFNHLASVDDAAEALDSVVKTAREEKDKTVGPSEEKDIKNKESGKLVIIILACIVGLAVIIFGIIIVKKRRKKNEK